MKKVILFYKTGFSKNLIVLTATLLWGGLFAACTENDDDSDKTKTEEKTDILGTWIASTGKYNLSMKITSSAYHFKLIEPGNGGIMDNGTYEISGEGIITFVNGDNLLASGKLKNGKLHLTFRQYIFITMLGAEAASNTVFTLSEAASEYTVTANIENSSSSIASVKALLEGDVLATASYSKSKFSITLPDPDKSYLEELYLGQTVEACILDGFYAYNSSGKQIGQIAYGVVSSDGEVDLAVFAYTAEAFTFNGKVEGVPFNLSCQKGWNILYFTYSDDDELLKCTTQKPDGMMWLYLEGSLSSSPAAEAGEGLKSGVPGRSVFRKYAIQREKINYILLPELDSSDNTDRK